MSGPRTHIEVAGHAATLAIQKASPEATGVYRCSVTGADGEASIAIPVAVRPRKPNRGVVKKPTLPKPAPRLQCDLQEVDLIEGQTIHLSANIAGDANRKDVKLFWEFRGQRLSADENEGVRMRVEDGVSQLWVSECTLADAGVYSCVLQCGDSRDQVKIPVKVRKRNDAGDPVIIKRTPIPSVPVLQCPPTIETDVDILEAELGQDVELSVRTTGVATVLWCRDGEEIKASEDPRVSVTQEDGLLRLVIKNVQCEDVGEYLCMVGNQFGENYAKILLCVVAPTDTSSDISRSDDLSYPPMLFCDKAIYEVNEGDSVALEVIYEGKPTPDITWLFDDEVVEAEMAKNLTRLFFSSVCAEDEGRYLCTASNEFGSKSMLIVMKVTPRDENIPHIVKAPRNVQCRLGRIVKLEVQVKGEFPMTCEWFHKGELIEVSCHVFN